MAPRYALGMLATNAHSRSAYSPVSDSMWQFYATQVSEISAIRTSLLLRVLSVDAQPFQTLLQSLLEFGDNWEAR